MRHRMIIALAFLFAILTVARAEGPNVKEGLWEITVSSEMQGMPVKLPPQTVRQCITRENPSPVVQEQEGQCQILSLETSGDKVTWEIQCRDKEGTYKIKGEATYHGATFEGKQEMTQYSTTLMRSTISGRWVGECE